LISLTIVTAESRILALKHNVLHKLLNQLTKKASLKGAFFVLCTLFFSPAQARTSCSPSGLSAPEKVTVKWVYDGDSLLLTDKRKIRIIGIDTPETRHHKQKAQAYGAKAREALRELLKTFNYQVELRYGKEKLDKYSRVLAHVYLADGTNISTWMLEQGYAKTLPFPPNIKLADCYKISEEKAQEKSLKIWRYKSHKIRDAALLPRRINGYVRLKGNIAKIKQFKKSLVMELESNSKTPIQLKIKKKNLQYFTKIDPDYLQNKTIIVTGLLRNKKGKRTVYVNHSSQIKIATLGMSKKISNKIKSQDKNANIKWSLQK
jgi:endonuclease YncB( thermonuclease family)